MESDHITDIGSTFDFKSFLLKVLSYWKLIVLSVAVCLGVAHYNNVRKLPVYRLDNMISIKDDQNPFFTSNTSLTFNWGGTSDKVNTAVTILKSRSHNEEVVERLQFYIGYLKDGEYQRVNAYGQTPFKLIADTAASQAEGRLFTIEFKDAETFTLSSKFPGGQVSVMNYGTKERSTVSVDAQEFSKTYKLDQKIDLPFFSGTFYSNEREAVPGSKYYVQFKNFDGVVGRFKNLSVNPQAQGSSVLRLSLTGDNKAEIVDYLNGSVQVLSENMLERKNLFATKTIRFIDSSLTVKSRELQGVEEELNQFRNRNNIIDITAETEQLTTRLVSLDMRKEDISRQLAYYETLEEYLQSRNDYTQVPAPSVAGISEESVVAGIQKIMALAEERRKYQYSLQENAPVFRDIDRQINAVKAVLLENMGSSQGLLRQELQEVNRDIATAEANIRELPQEQRDLLKIQRKYSLSEKNYSVFLEKRSEAGLIKAANVSDVMVIDTAKDTGGGQIGPNTQLNYVMALMVGGLVPLTFVFLLVFLNTNVHNAQEIAKLSPIPVLGIIGKSQHENNLVVFNESKSAIAESFRGLRSSLQFMYKKHDVKGTKTVLVTSSVSGEGKTFCAMNLATVFALSEKKTILIGADLRKPKIFDDFGIDNNTGMVNYLIQQHELEEIIQPSGIPHLDVITAGPIPPNPSELLMNEQMEVLMAELKEKYDYIIVDTPPVGIVADALNLIKYADATLYVVRQDYTKRGMLEFINEKYEKGEVKNISFVLNHFVQRAKYGYGYGYNYAYGSYGAGYNTKPGATGLKKWWQNFQRNFQ